MRMLIVAIIALGSAAVLVITSNRDAPVADANAAGSVGEQRNPKELGWVRWGRDYNEAKAISARTGKPMFLLFQEVPGCSTCVGFGNTVLSHPLMIETIETDFVPVAIFNNKGGADAEVLAKFSEPSWNNPVVRFVDGAGRDLVPRADNIWSTPGIAKRMVASLKAAKRPVPDYLRWVLEETAAATEKATFAMHCYWVGEACLGDITGVMTTRAGWLGGREVVEVEYDPARISNAELRRIAEKRHCGEFVAKARRARSAKASDRKYHLRHSTWKWVPLTPRQASRVNAAVRSGDDPSPWVSPRQKALHAQITRAQAKRRNALSELKRPDDVDALASYENALRTRLAEVLGR